MCVGMCACVCRWTIMVHNIWAMWWRVGLQRNLQWQAQRQNKKNIISLYTNLQMSLYECIFCVSYFSAAPRQNFSIIKHIIEQYHISSLFKKTTAIISELH